MTIAKKTNFKNNIANFFGAIGYLFCSLQWVWITMLYFSFIQSFVVFMTPSVNNNIVKHNTVSASPEALPIIVVAIVTVIMVALVIYMFIKIPLTIIKTSKKIVHQTSESVTPTILKIQNKKDTKRNHIKLSSNIVLVLKIILIIIPVILSFFSKFIEKQIIDYNIVMIVGLWLASLSLIFFIFQYLLARILLLSNNDIW